MTPQELAERGIRVKPLEWGPDMPPDSDCRYNHCASSGGAWTYQIEWKSWKEYDWPCLHRDGEYVTSEHTVFAAKAAAEADYAARIAAQLEVA